MAGAHRVSLERTHRLSNSSTARRFRAMACAAGCVISLLPVALADSPVESPKSGRLAERLARLAPSVPEDLQSKERPRPGETETAKGVALWMRAEAFRRIERGEISRALQVAERANALSIYVRWNDDEQSPAEFMRELKAAQRRIQQQQLPRTVAANLPRRSFQPAAVRSRAVVSANSQSASHSSRPYFRPAAYRSVPNTRTASRTSQVIVMSNARLEWDDHIRLERSDDYGDAAGAVVHADSTNLSNAEFQFSDSDSRDSHSAASTSHSVDNWKQADTELAMRERHHFDEAGIDGGRYQRAADGSDDPTTATKNAAGGNSPVFDWQTESASAATIDSQSEQTFPDEGRVPSAAEGASRGIEDVAERNMITIVEKSAAPRGGSARLTSTLVESLGMFLALLLGLLIPLFVLMMLIRRAGPPAFRVELIGGNPTGLLSHGVTSGRHDVLSRETSSATFARSMGKENEERQRSEAAMLKSVFEQNLRLREQMMGM